MYVMLAGDHHRVRAERYGYVYNGDLVKIEDTGKGA